MQHNLNVIANYRIFVIDIMDESKCKFICKMLSTLIQQLIKAHDPHSTMNFENTEQRTVIKFLYKEGHSLKKIMNNCLLYMAHMCSAIIK